MKSVGLCFVLLTSVIACSAQNPPARIKVDQVGYQPAASKIALVTANAESFELKRVSDGTVVFKGKLAPAALDADTGDAVHAADFSSFQQAGEYFVEVPNAGKSPAF